MSTLVLRNNLVRMSSQSLLKKVATGTLSKSEAKVAATILEKRFPTPKR